MHSDYWIFFVLCTFLFIATLQQDIFVKLSQWNFYNSSLCTSNHTNGAKKVAITRSRSLQQDAVTTITLTIKLDEFPTDTSWTLQLTKDGTIVESRQPGFYTEPRQFVVHHIDVLQGMDYQFTIFDQMTDGMTGFFELNYGKANIFGSSPDNRVARVNGFLGPDYTVTFRARSPTMNSTASPASVIVADSPTHAPTICTESLEMVAETHPFTRTPVFSTTRWKFGVSELICSSHTNYVNCTNERRQDCQWIFLTQGERMGKCRVDPIAKCLETEDCICSTNDFFGGTGDSLLFHAPISITTRDISPHTNRVKSYFEIYEFPEIQNQNHPQDDTFFISKVDFTGRQIHYTFDENHPILLSSNNSTTITFKLHFLYTDTPIVGKIWDGLGVTVEIDTSNATDRFGVMIVNGRNYSLPEQFKVWTCTQVAITPEALHVNRVEITRQVDQEQRVPTTADDRHSSIILGRFSGELFDVRVYLGSLSTESILEVGARCAGPTDYATIKRNEDIELVFHRQRCEDVNDYFYGKVPSNGFQTYGSNAFATLWVTPVVDPLNEDVYLDLPEGYFDEEYFFQTAKLQSYTWERQYFEHDMIGFVLEPYRMFSEDEVPQRSASTFNNPCKYIHQNNNNWGFPLVSEGTVHKWTAEEYGSANGENSNDGNVFDLGALYRGGEIEGYGYFTHEAFHEFHVTLAGTYNSQPNGWLQESASESSPALLFPGGPRILAPVALAPAWPLGFDSTNYDPNDELVANNPHIFTETLSINNEIRGGHYYGTWVLWWFLSQHAGLPHLLGQMFSIESRINGYWHGKLFVLRMLLHSNDIDLGDAWIVFVAHFRTWDFKNGDLLKSAEQLDFEMLLERGIIPSDTNFEDRKTQVLIDATSGTGGAFVPGPMAFRPTPFSWNCLTATEIEASKAVGITIRWDDGMGFASNVNQGGLVEQHTGCDDDKRFFSGIAVLYNAATGERFYWKLKGKHPPTLYIDTGNAGSVTLHVLIMPTPPVDYTDGRSAILDERLMPLPIYSYKYKIEIFDTVPAGFSTSAPAEKEYGIVKFDSSLALGWFSANCSCLDDPYDELNRTVCLEPKFNDVTPGTFTWFPTGQPSAPPTMESSSIPSSAASNVPTIASSTAPSTTSSISPSAARSSVPSTASSSLPSITSSVPTISYSRTPSASNDQTVSLAPITAAPSLLASFAPSEEQSSKPTSSFSDSPSLPFIVSQSLAPSLNPRQGASASLDRSPFNGGIAFFVGVLLIENWFS